MLLFYLIFVSTREEYVFTFTTTINLY